MAFNEGVPGAGHAPPLGGGVLVLAGGAELVVLGGRVLAGGVGAWVVDTAWPGRHWE